MSRELLKTFIPATLIALLAVAGLHAQCTLFVAPGGNDSNPGTQAAPLLNPAQALQVASPGAVVCLRAGTYPIAATLVITTPLTLQSYAGEQVLLSAVPAANIGNMVIVAVSNVTLQDLEIMGGQSYGIFVTSYITGQPPANAHIRRCKVHHCGYVGIKAYQSDSLIVEDSEVYAVGLVTPSGAAGIDIMAAIPAAGDPLHRGATVSRTFVHDVPGCGIYAKAGSQHVLFDRNRVQASGCGIVLGGSSGVIYVRDGVPYECIDCIARNNVISDIPTLGLSCWGGQNTRFYNNTVVNVASSIQAAFFGVPTDFGNGCTDLTVNNNVFVMSSHNRMIHMVNPGPGISFNNNSYFNSTGDYKYWFESPALTGYWDFNGWRQNTGDDANSTSGTDPGLDAAHGFSPAPGSPLIDKGVTLSEVLDDFVGTARPQGPAYDIGAYEVPVSTVPPAPRPASPVTVGIAPASVALLPGGSQLFTATVANTTNSAVNWSINPNVGSISTGGFYVAPSSISVARTIVVTATSVADSTASASALVTLQPAPSSGAGARFLKLDTTTQGSWKGVYGADGFSIANDATQAPSYGTVTPNNQLNYTWVAYSTSIRGLQKAFASDRVEATWYSPTVFNVDVNLTDSVPHQVAFYCLDFEAAGRAQTVDILDAQSGALLDSQSIGGFGGGVYLVWSITGHVTVRFTRTGIYNAVTGGVFFGGSGGSLAPPPPPSAPVAIGISPTAAVLLPGGSQLFTASVGNTANTAVNWSISPNVGSISAGGLYVAPSSVPVARTVAVTATSVADGTASASALVTLQPAPSSGAGARFLKLDTTTQGSWKGVYGADGFSIANDATQAPSYGTVAPNNQLNYTWVASTGSIRGLQKAFGSDRSEATWYSPTVFNVDVNLTDGAAHQVALYCLDFEAAGRAQTVDILDAQSGALLDSQSISGFGGGVYLVWSITGHVTVRFTRTGIYNAVTGGVFFGGSGGSLAPPPPPSAPVTISISPTATVLLPGGSQLFTARVGNTTNTAVNWSISPNVGSISAGGLYVAPSSVPVARTVAVTATSVADGTASASAGLIIFALPSSGASAQF